MARILVVDDESSIRRLLQTIVTKLGHEVIVASGAAEALQLFIKERPDVVLTDVVMPDGSGVDLLREIKRRARHTPVIIITGKPTVEAAVECLKTGATDYILKPVDLPHLRETLSKCIAELSKVESEESSISTVAMHVLNGYTIRSILGLGSTSVVYLAERDGDGQQEPVALKILKNDRHEEDSFGGNFTTRFSREARVIAQIRHPNIVRVLDYNVDEHTHIPYMALELVNGSSLKEAMPALMQTDFPTRLKIVRQIASALGAIHTLGLSHRDIKPQNILITEDHHVKLTDFGIVRTPDSELTLPNQLFGTPQYMAPESYSSSVVDGRADLFSLGVVAYELFVNQRPFVGESYAEIADSVKFSNPLDPQTLNPELPADVRDILARLLRKDVNRRYQSAADVVADIDATLDGHVLPSIATQTESSGYRLGRRDWA